MNPPIQQPTMTSLQIAEIAGKQHRHVLAAIRKMEEAWTKVTGSNFGLSEYTDPTGRALPCYNLTKEECLYIATKFNDEARARLILRWLELERKQAEHPADISDVFAQSSRLADEMRNDLISGKVLPVPNITLNANDIAIYCYLRNGIASSVDAPFCTSSTMISKTLGIGIADVEAAWVKLEQGAYIIRREYKGCHAFILGSRQP